MTDDVTRAGTIEQVVEIMERAQAVLDAGRDERRHGHAYVDDVLLARQLSMARRQGFDVELTSA